VIDELWRNYRRAAMVATQKMVDGYVADFFR
jgi:hypothetical protein